MQIIHGVQVQARTRPKSIPCIIINNLKYYFNLTSTPAVTEFKLKYFNHLIRNKAGLSLSGLLSLIESKMGYST